MRRIVAALLVIGTASLIYFKRITDEEGEALTSESIG